MKKEKKDIKKDVKTEKSILIAKIISVVALIVSAFALLLGCCACVSNEKDNNISVKDKSALNSQTTNEYFIYNQDYGYKLKSNLNSTEYNNYFTELDTYFTDSIDNYITFIYADIPGTNIYNVIDINFIDSTSYNFKCFTYDNDNLVYYNMDGSFQDLQESRHTLIFKFNTPILYSAILSIYYESVVLLKPTEDYGGLYYEDLTYGLLGAFNFNKSQSDLYYYFKGDLYFFDGELNYISFTFDYITIDYENGIRFYSIDDYAKPYYVGSEDNNLRRYYIKYLDENSENYVKITNLVLSNIMLSKMSNFFIDSHSIFSQEYNLASLYYYKYMPLYADNHDRMFYFKFKSNNKTFTSYRDIYNLDELTLRFRTQIYYGYQNGSELVLDVSGQPNLEGDEFDGLEFAFNKRLDYYQEFTIYDYFSKDIQVFQRYYSYLLLSTGDLINDDGFLTDALDLIMVVFTSFLPFLSFEIFPSITIGVLVLVPFLLTLMIFIFNMFKR